MKRVTIALTLAGSLCIGAACSPTVPLNTQGGSEAPLAEANSPAEKPEAEEARANPTASAQNTESPRAEGGGEATEWTTAVEPKKLSKTVIQGLDWLVATQLKDGSWDQGDQQVRNGERPVGSGNVADTCMATLALVRSGSSPSAGTYKGSVLKGAEFILKEVEGSDKDSLYVTGIRGTRVQSKIGTYVDTFTSLMVLTEIKGRMPDKEGNARVERAIDKIVNKIEKNQRGDGSWDNRGWAPVLTQSLAGKGLNRAAQQGSRVNDDTLKKVEKFSSDQYDARSGGFKASGSAGVDLYAGAANSSSLRDADNTYKTKVAKLRKKASAAPTQTARAEAERQLQEEIRDAAEVARAAESTEKALLTRLQDPNYISGFGSNGGEEFLSYMLVSESLVVKGGDSWEEWDETITGLLSRVQNGDGSWSGHHCITGRTFCTAAALLVLMADRAPVPVAAKMGG